MQLKLVESCCAGVKVIRAADPGSGPPVGNPTGRKPATPSSASQSSLQQPQPQPQPHASDGGSSRSSSPPRQNGDSSSKRGQTPYSWVRPETQEVTPPQRASHRGGRGRGNSFPALSVGGQARVAPPAASRSAQGTSCLLSLWLLAASFRRHALLSCHQYMSSRKPYGRLSTVSSTAWCLRQACCAWVHYFCISVAASCRTCVHGRPAGKTRCVCACCSC